MATIAAHDPPFEDFYSSLVEDTHFTDQLANHPQFADQIKSSLHALYLRANDDIEFRQRLTDSPHETALEFIQAATLEMELSDDQLESVAGGEITPDSSLGYDVGYVVGSTVEWIIGLFS